MAVAGDTPKRVLFVCLGNICRSTMAEGVMRDLVLKNNLTKQVDVDSCGTASYHVGSNPDKRTMRTLQTHGVDHYSHRGRQLSTSDFNEFDYILGMDESNMCDIKAEKPKGDVRAKVVRLLGSFDPQGVMEIADPYYSHNPKAFDSVYAQCCRCCTALLKEISGVDVKC